MSALVEPHGLSGHLDRGRHTLFIRVYFEDTDFSGLVYHTSYLRWCERGRSDFLRLLGISHGALAEGGPTGEPCAFAVRRLTADYLRPARIDDTVVVHTTAGAITKASITLDHVVLFASGDQELFRLTAQCVLISKTGRLLRLPPAILSALQKADSAHSRADRGLDRSGDSE